MKFSTRELVLLAVFGVLWGIVEISVGTVLKSLNIPFAGAVLGGIGLAVAMIGRVFVPRRGSTLFIGVIAMLLKLFSLGGVVIGPMIGILGEALVAELVLSLGGAPRRMVFVLAGALGVFTSFVQPFITGPLLFGVSLVETWGNTISQGSSALGLDASAIFIIVVLLIVVRLIIGGVAGWFAWDAGRELQKRMGRSLQPTQQDARGSGRLVPVAAAVVMVAVVAIFLAIGLASPAAETSTSAEEPAAAVDESAVQAALTVTDGETQHSLSLEDLQALTVTEAELNGDTYQGATLPAILEAAGVDVAGVTAIKSVASDGFASPYDAETLSREDVILAYGKAGGALDDEEAPFRMIVPGAENRMQARMVVELQVER
ncbi:MAG: molybdopterin-dependent oxidoreductase [Anaerolineae bacterium]|nr:molybdopterin-dependent oxidoreductase [Anaerolineae bacterium]